LDKISFGKRYQNKSLEDLIIKLGYDPSDVKAIEDIARKKNADIATLRKQLKLPSTEDPQTKEMGEMEKQRNTFSR